MKIKNINKFKLSSTDVGRTAQVGDSSRYSANPPRVTFDVGIGNASKKISKFGFELVDGKLSSMRDPRFDNFTKFLRTSSHDVIYERLQDIHLGENNFDFVTKSSKCITKTTFPIRYVKITVEICNCNNCTILS